MQQMKTVMRGWKPPRMPCCVPATAKDASPIVSIVCESHPSMPVPMCERWDTRDKIGHKMNVASAVTAHIPTYSTCGGRSEEAAKKNAPVVSIRLRKHGGVSSKWGWPVLIRPPVTRSVCAYHRPFGQSWTKS